MTDAASAARCVDVEIRKLETGPEFDACVRLQKEVWQFPDLDIIPRRMFIVARAVGGQVLGAWNGEELVGYSLAIPGVRDRQPFLHSHMLAVSPEYRNRGIGMRLKLAQREEALAAGIDRIEWTFDPLQIRNAYFNIEKLGAIARRYSVDFYGKSRSPLHRQLPTDRLHAAWNLRSSRVTAILEGKHSPEEVIKDTVPVTLVPSDAGDTLQPDLNPALDALLEVRRRFLLLFASGLAVLRFEIESDGAGRYLLGKPDA